MEEAFMNIISEQIKQNTHVNLVAIVRGVYIGVNWANWDQ